MPGTNDESEEVDEPEKASETAMLSGVDTLEIA
jgi:hypothetical protein